MADDEVILDAVRLTVHVQGRVQGVGYRDFCVRTARDLGRPGGRVTGYATNMDDGRTLEVVAEGPRDLLQQLLTELRAGPGGAHVVKVEPRWGPASREFERFTMR